MTGRTGRLTLLGCAAWILACGGREPRDRRLETVSEPAPDEPVDPPPSPEAPPGAASELLCELAPPAGDGALCWSCLAPDGALVTDGCAQPAEPAPEGSFCTAALEGELLCVYCCDPEGDVLVESCETPREPIEVTCEVYHDDGTVACTRCVTADGWIASDECVLYARRPA